MTTNKHYINNSNVLSIKLYLELLNTIKNKTKQKELKRMF